MGTFSNKPSHVWGRVLKVLTARANMPLANYCLAEDLAQLIWQWSEASFFFP
jgi:hypothetical protein